MAILSINNGVKQYLLSPHKNTIQTTTILSVNA